MDTFPYAISDKVLRIKKQKWEKETGLLEFMLFQARERFPGKFVHSLEYRFQPDDEEGGSYCWKINLCTREELKTFEKP